MRTSTPENENQKTNEGLTRRRFLETTVGTTVASAMAGSLLPHTDATRTRTLPLRRLTRETASLTARSATPAKKCPA